MGQQKKIAGLTILYRLFFCVPLNSTFTEPKEKLFGPFFLVVFMFKDQSMSENSESYRQTIYERV